MQNIHQKIMEALQVGIPVRSVAMGRVGQIIAANEQHVTVQHPHKKKRRGVTTFLFGDAVQLNFNGSQYKVENI